MKYFKKHVIISNDLKVGDSIKIANVVYCVTRVHRINKNYDISFHNVRRHILTGTMVLEANTLMTVYRPK